LRVGGRTQRVEMASTGEGGLARPWPESSLTALVFTAFEVYGRDTDFGSGAWRRTAHLQRCAGRCLQEALEKQPLYETVFHLPSTSKPGCLLSWKVPSPSAAPAAHPPVPRALRLEFEVGIESDATRRRKQGRGRAGRESGATLSSLRHASHTRSSPWGSMAESRNALCSSSTFPEMYPRTDATFFVRPLPTSMALALRGLKPVTTGFWSGFRGGHRMSE